jgi:hypothetical protein
MEMEPQSPITAISKPTKHTNRSKATIRIRKPQHALPREYAGENKAAWDDLDKEEQ